MVDPLQALVQEMADEGARDLAPPLSQSQVNMYAAQRYSHQAMVDLMVEHPEFSHGQLAQAFGRPPSWISTVLASEAFQACLDTRRHEVADPSLTATMDERFRALAIRSVSVLQEKLNSASVNDLVVLKAAEIGVKALGMGQRPVEAPALPPPVNSSQSAAEKILAAMDELDRRRAEAKAEAVDVEAREVPEDGE